MPELNRGGEPLRFGVPHDERIYEGPLRQEAPWRAPGTWGTCSFEVRERRLSKFRQNVARFRLYRLRFLQENIRFAAFFKIYQILKLKFLKFDKILQILRHLQFFC